MQVSVDRERCQGHNRCCAEAPELFDMDDDMKAVVLAGAVPVEQERAARSAARNCPERAIVIVDA